MFCNVTCRLLMAQTPRKEIFMAEAVRLYRAINVVWIRWAERVAAILWSNVTRRHSATLNSISSSRTLKKSFRTSEYWGPKEFFAWMWQKAEGAGWHIDLAGFVLGKRMTMYYLFWPFVDTLAFAWFDIRYLKTFRDKSYILPERNSKQLFWQGVDATVHFLSSFC